MSKNLVIVESPAKAKTIEKYLGDDYSVRSSFGHIRDLPKKGMGIDIANGFVPAYEVSNDKKKTVSELKKAAKAADTVWLASDEDREGEAIAWHLCQALGLNPTTTKRIVFHEITKTAILEAIKQPRSVNQNLVDAQQARRILDRLVGYELSPVLWKKLRPGLSAGRVQSVAVRLIVEREREIRAYEAQSNYKVIAEFDAEGGLFQALADSKHKEKSDATSFLESCIGAKYKISDIKQKPGSRSPGAPFTTSTLQQEAARRLGFSVKQTMTLAQRLYESGFITYMRTDSMTLSDLALNNAEAYILKNLSARYYHRRQYSTKSKGAQEAHEAIRPTDFNKETAGKETGEQRLYQLIWQRALASQMAAAELKRTDVIISISTNPEFLSAKGEVLAFDGFYKIYQGRKEDLLLPELSLGQELTLNQLRAIETYSRPPARYTEASLVRTLESLGIGRPSTYAPTISTVQDRGYVVRGEGEGTARALVVLTLQKNEILESSETEKTGSDKGKLLPTDVAEVTIDFLINHFAHIVDYDFTARSEAEFDQVAEGKIAWQDMIKDFYTTFHPLVEKSGDISRQEAVQARVLGDDPASGRPLYARFGRYGGMLQIGDKDDEVKPVFAPLPKGTTIDTVNFEQAIEMFKLPRTVGTTADGKAITANIGRFGPYIQVDKLYVSLKEHDPLTIDEATSRLLIAEKAEAEAKKVVHDFGDKLRVLNGPYGAYVTDGTKNARIPKTTDPLTLTKELCLDLIAKAPAKKKGFRRRGK